jgi:hypothetical protein
LNWLEVSSLHYSIENYTYMYVPEEKGEILIQSNDSPEVCSSMVTTYYSDLVVLVSPGHQITPCHHMLWTLF